MARKMDFSDKTVPFGMRFAEHNDAPAIQLEGQYDEARQVYTSRQDTPLFGGTVHYNGKTKALTMDPSGTSGQWDYYEHYSYD